MTVMPAMKSGRSQERLYRATIPGLEKTMRCFDAEKVAVLPSTAICSLSPLCMGLMPLCVKRRSHAQIGFRQLRLL